ncbi:MAG: CAP domain-containing protein, partial [Polyangiaceae bacterium]
MILRSNLPLLLTCLAVAGCTTKADALGFGDLQPYSLDASDLTANDAGADAAALGSDSAIPGPDASTGAAPDHPEAGTPEASSGEDAGGAGDAGGNDASGANAETGRLVGITAAHNAVRAMISTQPPLPDLTWSPTLAAYAQAWATQLASSPSTCMNPQHRSGAELQAKDYGENLADFSVSGAPGNASNAQQAVDDWAAEKMCWTYGTILG